MAKYDTEALKLTPRFVESLQELMEANMEMMREHEPDLADCWTWGICKVADLANSNGLSFTYGGDEDRPAKLPAGISTLVVEV